MHCLLQEFELNKAIILMDSILLSPNKIEYLNFLCLGILYLLREELLISDYSEVLLKI